MLQLRAIVRVEYSYRVQSELIVGILEFGSIETVRTILRKRMSESMY